MRASQWLAWRDGRGGRGGNGLAPHTRFLGRLIDSPDITSVRSEHGFLFGLPRQGHVFVDDMAVEDDAYWPDEGTALLRHAGNAGPLRFVCPVPEQERAAAARSLGLTVTESWWHRDRAESPAAAADLLTAAGYRRTTDYYSAVPCLGDPGFRGW